MASLFCAIASPVCVSWRPLARRNWRLVVRTDPVNLRQFFLPESTRLLIKNRNIFSDYFLDIYLHFCSVIGKMTCFVHGHYLWMTVHSDRSLFGSFIGDKVLLFMLIRRYSLLFCHLKLQQCQTRIIHLIWETSKLLLLIFFWPKDLSVIRQSRKLILYISIFLLTYFSTPILR